MGFDALRETVLRWSPRRVKDVSGVPGAILREAAKILGRCRSLVSTVLQGVYQSMQATAAAWPAAYAACRAAPRRSLAAPIAWPAAVRAWVMVISPRAHARACSIA